jgi:CBS domain-containing protein
MPRISDVLRGRELYSVESTQSVLDVAEWMAELNVGAIVVVDREELCGVFSERDLLKRVVVERSDPERIRVGAVMTADPVTIDVHATVEEAMEKMRRHNIRHLPVMDGDHVTGFLSLRDLVNLDLEQKTDEVQHMRAYISGSG